MLANSLFINQRQCFCSCTKVCFEFAKAQADFVLQIELLLHLNIFFCINGGDICVDNYQEETVFTVVEKRRFYRSFTV